MRYSTPPLPALHAFEAAARHSSFSSAAKELNLAQATVSHRIRQLEGALQCKLFHRKPRSLELTEMGKAYLPSVRKLFDDLSVSTTGLFGALRERVRPLAVRAPVSFGTLWLAPRIDLFCEEFPSIDLRLKSSVWAGDALDDDVDVEIRFGHGQWPGFHAERLDDDVAYPVCSPQTLAACGTISDVKEFAACSLVHILSLEDLWQLLFRDAGVTGSALSEGIVVDTTIAALEMAAAGRRFAIAPHRLLKPYLDSGRLVVALNEPVTYGPAHYVVTSSEAGAPNPEALLFQQWLREQMRH